MMDAFLIAAGFGLLFLGGEGLVRGSVAVAERFGLSKLLIGLVIVGFGTSTPELLVSVKAALSGASSIALGNVVGSNIANILLILGLSIAIAPLMGWKKTAMREALIMTLVALALFGLVQGAEIGRIAGLVLLGALVIYLAASWWMEKREADKRFFEHEAEAFDAATQRPLWLSSIFIVAGIATLMLGADLLVKGAINIASAFGVPDAVIGLTIVAVGTSLPELATAIVAALKKHGDMVLGNVIGSNIFNILAILGATAALAPIGVEERFRTLDVPLMVGVSALVVLALFAFKKLGRGLGLIMIASYAAYAGLQFA
jgi:cation:H+ antiporter